jgi:hypothetical protein
MITIITKVIQVIKIVLIIVIVIIVIIISVAHLESLDWSRRLDIKRLEVDVPRCDDHTPRLAHKRQHSAREQVQENVLVTCE